jgi:hypothetical protein
MITILIKSRLREVADSTLTKEEQLLKEKLEELRKLYIVNIIKDSFGSFFMSLSVQMSRTKFFITKI